MEGPSKRRSPRTKISTRKAQKLPTSSSLFTFTSDQDELECDDKINSSIRVETRRLTSDVFQTCQESIWKRFSKETTKFFVCVDCLWFEWYRQKEMKIKVLNWIEKRNIFSKRYVLIPIVCWSHWRLAILCNFGECFQSEASRKCILVFDSLKSGEPEKLEPDIKKFIRDIYVQEGRADTKDAVAKIPFLVPKVPQQMNSDDCGIFVLYYIKMFMEDAAHHLSNFESYLSSLNENWFSNQELENFWKEVCTSVNEAEEV